MYAHVRPSATATASTHAAVIASAGRVAPWHVPPASEQVASQFWPDAPIRHAMPTLPH